MHHKFVSGQCGRQSGGMHFPNVPNGGRPDHHIMNLGYEKIIRIISERSRIDIGRWE